MPSSSQPGGAGVASTLDTLLILSRSLTGAKQGGMLADALDLLLAGVGCARGAAYAVVGPALELVGERGLPAALRVPLERLPLTGPPWFAAQKAAQTRKLVADRDLEAAASSPLDRGALARARWGQVVACPVAVGREVYGVLVFAWPPADEPEYATLAVVEIACNMLAIQMARRSDEHRRGEGRGADVRAARMATLGMLAGGFAEELDAQLADVGRRLDEQQRIGDTLRARLAVHEGDAEVRAVARAERAADPVEVLRPAREGTARFLAAIQPSAPDRVELGALVADVLALVAPHLRRRRIAVELRAGGEHFVVGRRNELIQLFVQLVLDLAGVLDDADEICSDRSALIPRGFALDVSRQGAHELVSLSDADAGTGARSSFFEIGAQARDRSVDLAVARQIVIAHEGHIEIGPTAGAGGARFSVVLPAAEGESERRAARTRFTPGVQRPSPDQAPPVLLWIDEDDLFLEIMVQSLPDLEVRVARSAAEGMQLLTLGANPAVVFCNVRLPDRAGHQLHADVARQSPKLAERFVFVTDGVLTPEIASYLVASGLPTLMRPIKIEEVRALALRDPAAPGRAAGAVPTLAERRPDPRRALTMPAVPAFLPPAPRDADPQASPSPGAQGAAPAAPARAPAPVVEVVEGERPSIMREQELGAIARAAADTLRREGPRRLGMVSSMLRDRGLSEPEALSVITYALEAGLLVRDPPPSSMLRVPDADPRKTVLVVDDDFDLRHTVREILQDEGWVVDTAANGREALELLRRSNPPRVLVLDLMMPVMDGWQLLDELRRDSTLADIPVVVISAGKTGLRAVGTHAFLSKPLDYHKLIATIDRSMRPLRAGKLA